MTVFSNHSVRSKLIIMNDGSEMETIMKNNKKMKTANLVLQGRKKNEHKRKKWVRQNPEFQAVGSQSNAETPTPRNPPHRAAAL